MIRSMEIQIHFTFAKTLNHKVPSIVRMGVSSPRVAMMIIANNTFIRELFHNDPCSLLGATEYYRLPTVDKIMNKILQGDTIMCELEYSLCRGLRN